MRLKLGKGQQRVKIENIYIKNILGLRHVQRKGIRPLMPSCMFHAISYVGLYVTTQQIMFTPKNILSLYPFFHVRVFQQ